MDTTTALSLDPTTLLFTISVMGFATSAFAFSSSRAVGNQRVGLVEWSLAMAAVGTAFLLLFLRTHAPLFLTYVIANGLILAVPGYVLRAHTRFFDMPPPHRAIGMLAALGMVGPLAVYAFAAPLGAGVFTLSATMATMLVMTARLLIQKKGLHLAAPSTFAALTILLLAAVLVVRAIVSIAGGGASVSVATGSAHNAWPLVLGMVFVVGATIGFVMMVHDKQRKAELQSSRRDALTGLQTRAAFFEAASSIQARVDEPYALVVVDIDHFKDINDSYGHASGDLVLARVGQLILRSIRKLDVAGRFGGDEFCVVLPGCGLADACRFAERLVLEASRERVDMVDGESLSFTMSAGYAVRLDDCSHGAVLEPAERVFERADAALYEAKRAGRARALAAPQVVIAA